MRLSYTILYVSNVQSSVQFYQDAFGLKHKFTHESGDYAEMDTGEVTLAFCGYNLANDILKQEFIKASQELPIGAQISLEPDNLKLAFESAIKHGAKALVQPETKPWGWESAILMDQNGHIVELAKKIKD